jgi:hypothetical protein
MKPHKQGERLYNDGDRLAELEILAAFRDDKHGFLYSVRNVVTGIESMRTHAQLEPYAKAEKHDLG